MHPPHQRSPPHQLHQRSSTDSALRVSIPQPKKQRSSSFHLSIPNEEVSCLGNLHVRGKSETGRRRRRRLNFMNMYIVMEGVDLLVEEQSLWNTNYTNSGKHPTKRKGNRRSREEFRILKPCRGPSVVLQIGDDITRRTSWCVSTGNSRWEEVSRQASLNYYSSMIVMKFIGICFYQYFPYRNITCFMHRSSETKSRT